MSDDFVHLHVHDEYSMLDGAADTSRLVARAAEIGQPAIAQTNHGNLHGSYRFWKAATAAGVKPILGMEAYVSPLSAATKEPVHFGRDEESGKNLPSYGAYTHLTLLARNSVGLRNLSRLSSSSYSKGFYHKPRIGIEQIGSLSEGITVLSGCLSGELLSRLQLGQTEEAEKYVRMMKERFGEHFYIEVMDHGFERESRHTAGLVDLGRRYGVQLVATNDSHYISVDDSITHDAMLCLQTRTRLDDPKRMRFDGSGYFLKSASEMVGTGLPVESLRNTLHIAEQVETYTEFFDQPVRFPPSGYANDTYELTNRVEVALMEYTDTYPAYRERANHELRVINKLGFPGYFLVIADLIGWAKSQDIRIGPGRGSAGGSVVAYLLGITALDPIEHGLIFERFLNEDRVSLPDIDTDVSDRDRDRFLEHVREIYGPEYCAQIGTISTIAAKAAIKDSTRILGLPYGLGEKIGFRLPRAEFGRSPNLNELNMTNATDDERRVIDLALPLEGLARQAGVHPAGFVISDIPISQLLPTWNQRVSGESGPNITQWDQHAVEAMGLVKLDFLGLKNLGVIDECMHLLSERERSSGRTESTSPPKLPTALAEFTDRATFELLSSGFTTGVFQCDSSGMQRTLRAVGPRSLHEVALSIALYRPGSFNHVKELGDRKRAGGWSDSWLPDPSFRSLREVLRPTYGVLVFQEQIIQMLQVVAGYTASQADLVRKAMGKKDRELLHREYERFYDGCVKNQYTDYSIRILWDLLVPFADYSFNKSHAVGYAYVSYWEAYLKANHPKEFMAALLSREGDPKKLAEYVTEARRMGIRVLSPDVNDSGSGWTPTTEGIRYGLASIKGVGSSATKVVSRNRPYKSWSDYLQRVGKPGLNTGLILALTEAGAFDSLGTREAIEEAYEGHVAAELAARVERGRGEQGLFRRGYSLPQHTPQYEQRKTQETARLGVSLSEAPVVLSTPRSLSIADWQFIRQALVDNPGGASVTFTNGWEYTPDYRVDGDAVRRLLKPLGVK